MLQVESEIKELKEAILNMASLCSQVVELAVKGLIERDDEKLQLAIEKDEEIDELEVDIDGKAFFLLSKAPLAGDLRLIMIAIKASSDLERIGDESTTIARRGLELSKAPQLRDYTDISRMTQISMEMLRDAFAAFVSGDSEGAREIVLRDKEVDRLNKQQQRELTDYMKQNPDSINRCLHLMTISKSVERIGDHAKNIAEEVVFIHEGEDIRHQGQSPSA